MRWIAAIALAGIALCATCAADAAKLGGARRNELPRVLRGTWEIGPELCKLPGNGDSDSRIVIEARKINGYEHWSQILAVTQISTVPLAWKVRRRDDAQGDIFEVEAIFSITSEDQGSLVIIDSSQDVSYRRCT